MSRSSRPTVWIEPRPPKRGPYRIRAELNGRRLPDLPAGMSAAHARQMRVKREEELWAGQLDIASADKRSRTLERFAAEHLSGMRATLKADNTVRIAERALELLQDFAGPGFPLRAFDRAMAQRCVAWFVGRKYRRKGDRAVERTATVNGARVLLRTLRTAFRTALKDEKIDKDPFFGVELPPEIEVAHPPTPEEVSAMWPFIPWVSRRAIAAGAFMGFRRGEILQLHGPRSRSESRLIPPAAEGEPWIARVRKTKTRRGKVEYKEVAVPPEALACMAPIPDDGPLFPQTYRVLQSHLQKARERAGLGRIRLHDFRHRWATEFMDAVKNKYALRDAGGWTTDATLGRYQHQTEERRRANLLVGPKIPIPPPQLPQDRGEQRGGK